MGFRLLPICISSYLCQKVHCTQKSFSILFLIEHVYLKLNNASLNVNRNSQITLTE